MSKKTDDSILGEVDVPQMLEALGLRNISVYGDECNASCPFPGHSHGDSKPSFYMNLETTLYYCHGCKRAGNAATFLAEYENVSLVTAFRWLRETWGDRFREPDDLFEELNKLSRRSELRKLRQEAETIGEDKLDMMIKADWHSISATHEMRPFEIYARSRFPADALESWEICFDQISGRLAIPARNQHGELVGFKGRAIDDDSIRYMELGDTERTMELNGEQYGFRPYKKRLVANGIHRIGESGRVVITEGEFDAMMLQHHDIPGVATGAELSDEQAGQILDIADHVTIFFDSDQAGIQGALKAMRKLERHAVVNVVGSHDGDPGSMDPKDIHRCIDNATPSTLVWT